MKLCRKKYHRNGKDTLRQVNTGCRFAPVFLVIWLFSFFSAGAQTIFQTSFSNGFYLCGNDIQQKNGWYYIGGTAKDALSSGFFLMKTDNYGDSVWTREFYGALPLEGKKIILQGNFIYLAGNCNPNMASSRGFIAKVTTGGVVLWSKTFGSAGPCEINDILLRDDSTLVLTGSVSGTGSGGKDILVAVFDTSGSFRWAKAYGKTGNESGSAVVAGSGTGLYLTGNTDYNDPEGDIFILELSADGLVQWCKNYDILHNGFSGQNAYDLMNSAGGNLVVSGNTKVYEFSPTDQIWNPLVIKTNETGNVVYAKEYELNSGGGAAYQVMETDDGEMAFTGYMRISFGLLVKTDQVGATSWSKVYGFDPSGIAYLNQAKAFVQHGSSYVMTGYIETQSDTALYLVKANQMGVSGCLESEPASHANPTTENPAVSDLVLNVTPVVPDISIFPVTCFSPALSVNSYCETPTGYPQPAAMQGVYPNPVKDFLHLTGLSQPSGYRLYDIHGNLVGSGHETRIDFRPYEAGIYFLTAYDHGTCYTYKIIRLN